MEDKKELQSRMDGIDDEIVRLFEERLSLGEALSRIRIDQGDKMIDKGREQARIEHLAGKGGTPFSRHALRELFAQIEEVSRIRQYQLLEEEGISGRLPFIAVDELEKENVRVVFQGVEGAYSHAAMCRYFGDDVKNFHVDSWREAMEAIADGEADYAVLPIENSSAGVVADNLDLLVDFENYIVAEQVIRCEHVLMGVPGSSLSDIKTVISHQQALSQCAAFLDTHPAWERQPFANTAMAARKVAVDGDKSQAAIGSAFAAQRFGLDILADHIFFNEANSTRFIIATNQRIFRRDAGKISICFEVPHQSGSLYRILSHFIYNNLNMNRIESRPIIGRNWEYHFFVDFDGNLNQSSVKNALRGIRSEAANMKILGNY